MDLNTKSIFIAMFQLAQKGKLTNLEQKDIITALNSYGMSLLKADKTFEEISKHYKEIRVGSRILLEQTESCIDSALETIKLTIEFMDKQLIDVKNLPEYAKITDDANTIAFIKSLKDDLYNFTQAQGLLKTSRQTLKKYAIKKQRGLKIIIQGKSEYLLKEDMIVYYRNRFNKSDLPF